MKLLETELEGVYIIENFVFFDERGGFVKTFNDQLFKSYDINFEPKEIYYSISKKNVIRGMHFQTPPFEHAKIIYLTSGKILDVILDIRKNSKTYGKTMSVELEAHKNSIYIPIGFAHGFKSLCDKTIVVYNQTSCYSKKHDDGILWSSFGFDWEIKSPILTQRDKQFIPFNKFNSPFE